LQGEPVEQIAAIKIDRLPQGFRRARAHQPLESRRVDVHGFRGQGNRRSLDA
jgi:hypothetical protein